MSWLMPRLVAGKASYRERLLQTAAEYWHFTAGNLAGRSGALPSFTRASAGYYTDSTGALQVASTDAPRFDYNPATLAARGLLMEPASTYLDMRSAELDNASYWSPGNVTVTPGAALGIDGAMSAYKVEATSSAATALSHIAVATATAHYYTIRAAKGSGATDCNRFAIYNYGTGLDVASLSINYDTGALTQTVGTGATATNVGNGLWEIRIPVTSGINISDNLNFYLGFVGAPETAGEYAYICAPDVADQPGASHYPTAGSTETRAADAAVVDLTTYTHVVNPAAFTFACAFDGAHVPATPADHMVINLSGAGGSEQVRINVYGGVIYAEAISGSVSVASLGLGACSAGRNVVALSVAANNFSAIANGGSLASDTSGAMPALTALGIGCNPAGSGSESGAAIGALGVFGGTKSATDLARLVEVF